MEVGEFCLELEDPVWTDMSFLLSYSKVIIDWLCGSEEVILCMRHHPLYW